MSETDCVVAPVRAWANQSGKRQVVVIVRERDGNSVPAVFRTEGAAQSWIKSRIAKGRHRSQR